MITMSSQRLGGGGGGGVQSVDWTGLASFPGRFGREKRPGNFRKFKLYTEIMSQAVKFM